MQYWELLFTFGTYAFALIFLILNRILRLIFLFYFQTPLNDIIDFLEIFSPQMLYINFTNKLEIAKHLINLFFQISEQSLKVHRWIIFIHFL